MSIFKKIHRKLTSFHRKLGLSKRASQLVARSITGDSVGALRALQRSHKFGRVGKSLLPTNSDSNYLTHAWNKLKGSISRMAERQVAKQSATNSSKSAAQAMSYQARPLDITANRVDYRYRRLADLIADEVYRGK